jgi:dsDNA-binding SOS-regulon protein
MPSQGSPSSQGNATSGPTHDNDTTPAELSRFDQFLDSHHEIAEQLRKDPSLVNNERFVKDHPALQSFLRDHPGVREEIRENPNAFMRQENRFDRREDRRGGDIDAGRSELQRFNEFLDSHHEIAEQVRKNPSLMNNEGFVENHPALLTYLQEHPEARQQIRQNPNSFMQAENNFDRREDMRDNDANRFERRADARDNDANREEHERFDRFLDGHREIAEQVRKNPSLVNNEEFSKNHPELQAYLKEHPEVRDNIRENPNGFMHPAEGNFDRHEEGGDRDVDRDRSRKFGEFLGGHRDIANELSRDPSQAKNREFVEHHPELQSYLKTHPDVNQELMKNPQGFVKSAQLSNNDYQGGKAQGFDSKPNH